MLLRFLSSLLLVVTLAACKVEPTPSINKRVNDNAGVFSLSQKDFLEKKLIAIQNSYTEGPEVVVVTLKQLPENTSIERHANDLFRAWGLGKRNVNNGLLLIVTMKERKIRIEVGTGLEGAIPDQATSRIIREKIIPHFKTKEFYKGIEAGVIEIGNLLHKEYNK